MLDFPSSPSVGQIFVSGGTTWTWDGAKWVAAGAGGASSIYLPLTGGTLSGPLTVSAPTSHIDNAVIGATNPAAGSFTSLNGGQLAGLRNLIINGDMRIDQRNGGAGVAVATGVTAYGVDRWATLSSVAIGMGVNRQAVTTPGSPWSLQVSTGTAHPTTAAGDAFFVWQTIEGQNMAHLGWGAAGAKPITISGTIMGSTAGNATLAVRNSASNRSYTALLPVTTVETPFAITIPGDIAGTWAIDNTGGMVVSFDIGSGSTVTSAANGVWSAGNFIRGAGASNLVATAAVVPIRIKDVQVEAGSIATPFERRPIGTELDLCQRYYQRYTSPTATFISISGYSAAGSYFQVPFNISPSMRVAPTVSVIGAWASSNLSSLGIAAGLPNLGNYNLQALATGVCWAQNPANGGYDLSAEL